MRSGLTAALVAAGLAYPAAAMAAPTTLAPIGVESHLPLTLIRDGEEYSGANQFNRWRRWGNWDSRYGYGPYYGYRGRPFGYDRYYGPSYGLGLSRYPYYRGPSFGIYVNP